MYAVHAHCTGPSPPCSDGRMRARSGSHAPTSQRQAAPPAARSVFESKFLRNYYTSAVVFIWLRVQCKIKQKTAVSESKSQNFLRDGGKPPNPALCAGVGRLKKGHFSVCFLSPPETINCVSCTPVVDSNTVSDSCRTAVGL